MKTYNMFIISPKNPSINAIIFFIFIIILILLIRPNLIYCKKTNKLKSFGIGKNKTILTLPIISVGLGIIFYTIFLLIEILYIKLANQFVVHMIKKFCDIASLYLILFTLFNFGMFIVKLSFKSTVLMLLLFVMSFMIN